MLICRVLWLCVSLSIIVPLACGGTDEGDASAETCSLTVAIDEPENIELPEPEPELGPPPSGYIRTRHILVSWIGNDVRGVTRSRSEAVELMNEIRATINTGGATFEEMAYLYSDCSSASDSGLLPDFTQGGMVAEFENAAFDTDSGEVSGIIETDFGLHLIKRVR